MNQEQADLARHLRCPTGTEGLAVGERMAVFNAMMNRVALEHLDPGPSDRVLEIGFGPGALLDQLVLRSSFVAGLDLSPTMVNATRRRLVSRVQVCCGSAAALPFAESAFTKVCTVNTVYFWKNLSHAFGECRRVLRPGGALVICFNASHELQREAWDQYGFTLYNHEDVIGALRTAGFVQMDLRPERDPEQGEFFSLRAAAGSSSREPGPGLDQ